MAALCLCGPAAAQEVTLRFPDGSFSVTGPLLGFDGEAYRVDTRFGVLTIAADTVDCEGDCPARADAPVIRLAGSPLMAEILMPALVDAFARSLGVSTAPLAVEGGVGLSLLTPDAQTLAQFEVRPQITADGFAALARNEVDIVLSDRDHSVAEQDAVAAAGLGDISLPLRRRLIARRKLGLYVPSDLPIRRATVSELLTLAAPNARWSDIGGPDLPAVLTASAPEAAAAHARLEQVATYAEREVAVTLSPAPEGEQPAGVAWLSTEAPDGWRPVALSHGCEPGSADGATGDAHPLMLHLWAYTAAPRLPDMARAFLAFASGPEAQRVVDRAGFIDQRPRPIPLDAQGDRIARAVSGLSEDLTLPTLQAAVGRLWGYDRLSTVFRFEPGTRRLTRESASEAQSLAALLDTGRYDGRELLFIGLTDSLGAAEVNRRLSQSRADVTRSVVQDTMVTRRDRLPMIAEGMGELFPLACDETAWGQHVNRRVEVWLGPAP